jgi:hypothetical protein
LFGWMDRMFVDALDFQNYEEHHDHEHCCFARSKREVILTIQNRPNGSNCLFSQPALIRYLIRCLRMWFFSLQSWIVSGVIFYCKRKSWAFLVALSKDEKYKKPL